ncbi:ABC transporter substrate-binding protein [Anaerosacchariphilus polymeriproducens]|uniref:ABC transporter substrate-binding protein n=1 Tax=Anaerosacchariphilus polymeriproducens TaxID=1812858 RepID=A0A371AXH6_9FIRM|nr:ABC transporter substrate-binding protein [Anaerosacchariphilus polymeriproducens]RDU24278.1 ABC transporter substrate-binding protein [Anaerosacchariphilus polymeriproducens]
MKKLRIIAIIFLLSIWSMAGCSNKENVSDNIQTQEQESNKITDMAGNEINLKKTPEKMVVLLPSDVEILYELGADKSIIGVGEYCNYPKEALNKKIIATGDDLNVEQIISLNPDVVVIGEMAQSTDQMKQLKDAGILVAVTNSQNIADTYKAIKLLGQISGKEKEADDLIANMKDSFQELEKKSKGNFEKTIYFEVSPLEFGLWTAGKDTFMQELADMLKVKNIFEDLPGWAEISEEQVLERNPDFIVTTTMSNKDSSPVDEILARNNWENIEAISKKQVFKGDSDMMTRPGPRLVDAAKELYKFIYGE